MVKLLNYRYVFSNAMGKITDTNIVGIEEGKFASILGEAAEYIVTGILLKLGFDVSMTCLSGEPYDLSVKAFKSTGEPVFLRCQVKVVSKGGSIKFKAGIRAGVDREYKSGVKEYKYTTEHNDLIIGFDRDTLDLYLIPTLFIKDWGDSKSVKLLRPLKNRWELLLNWEEEYLEKLRAELSGGSKLSKFFSWLFSLLVYD